MYLTKEEFLVLSARKMGINVKQEIAQKFNLSEATVALCDRALYKKYGIEASSLADYNQKLVETADLNKVMVVDIDKMPYVEYEKKGNDYILVKKMRISKKEGSALSKYFADIRDDEEYELILDDDVHNMYRTFEIKNISTGKKENLPTESENTDFNKNTMLIGIGGGGQNIVNYIFNKQIDNLRILSINSDEQALNLSKTQNILLCENPGFVPFFARMFGTKSHLGCGGDIEKAKTYTLASKKKIKKEIKKAKEIILISCFGGGTGTGSAPLVAKYAHELGIAVKAIIVNPFNFEGSKRNQRAQEGINELKKYAQDVYEVRNEDLIDGLNKDESFRKVFNCANEKKYQMINDIIDKTNN